MTGMEYEALDTIVIKGGRLHYYLIAEELRISSHYAFVICKGLERKGYVDFDTLKGICELTEEGKDAIEKNWLFKLKRKRERVQENTIGNKRRIFQDIETINY